MSQSSSTTYSTGTGSTSSATTVTSPGTSKGSWGDMMTSTNTGQVNQARPLPIPQGQSGTLDAVSPPSMAQTEADPSHASYPATASDQLPSQCQLPVDPYRKSQPTLKLSPNHLQTPTRHPPLFPSKRRKRRAVEG